MKNSISNLINFYRKEISNHIYETKPYKISKELKKFASLFAPGKFYYYVINFQKLEMDFASDGIKNVLGIEPHQFTVNELLNRIHPDDLLMMEKKEALATDFLLNYLKPFQIPLYKVVYFFRVRGVNNKYRKIMHQTTVLTVADSGKLIHVLGVHTDVTHLPIIFNDQISFISLDNDKSFLNLNVTSTKFTDVAAEIKPEIDFANLFTKREKEIIKYLMKGYTSKEIAKELFISNETSRTHRRNILQKSGCKNRAELISKCLIEGII